jgi:hypothetical protein
MMSNINLPNDARKKMLKRVRALLAKTMARGCTEGEAMAALEKARELMAAKAICSRKPKKRKFMLPAKPIPTRSNGI